MTVIKLNAGNTPNGNPRRVYVLLVEGKSPQAWDEGYRGYGAVPETLRSLAHDAATFQTTPSEYRRILKDYSA